MSNIKYCQACGARNMYEADFCCKCVNPFNPEAKAKLKEKEDEEEIKPKKKKRKLREVEEEEEIYASKEEEEKEGVSLNHCPKINQLSIEELTTDEVPKFSLDAIIEEGKRQQRKSNA